MAMLIPMLILVTFLPSTIAVDTSPAQNSTNPAPKRVIIRSKLPSKRVFFFAYYNSRMTKVPRSQCINPLLLKEKTSNVLVVFRKTSANFGGAYRRGLFRAPVNGLYKFDVNFEFTGTLTACVYVNETCYTKINGKGSNTVVQRTVMIRLKKGAKVSVRKNSGGIGSVSCRPLAAYFSGELLATFSSKP